MGSLITLLTWASFSVATVSAQDLCDTLVADWRRKQLRKFDQVHDRAEDWDPLHHPHIRILQGKGQTEVTVGNKMPYHPMTITSNKSEVHFISHLYLVDQNQKIVGFAALDPTLARFRHPKRPVYIFDIPQGVTSLHAFTKCNRHGLHTYKGIKVPAIDAIEPTFHCNVSQLSISNEEAWPTLVADLERHQRYGIFQRESPFNSTDEGANMHVPWVHVDRHNYATVIVGDTNAIHPMVAANEPYKAHWITHIFVVDHKERIVAFEALDPSKNDRASISFKVPEFIDGLVPFAHCNLHGLWKGHALDLKSGEHFEL